MKKIILIIKAFFVSIFSGCNPTKNTQNAYLVEYDFLKPSQKYLLPDVLEEISGIAYYGNNQLLCVQDELGEAFVYDLNTQKIISNHEFSKEGDYEGIENVGSDIYVLKSNGNLLNFRLNESDTTKIDTDLPNKNDVEGLTYNATQKRLWIAVKEATKKGEVVEDKLIYSYDLHSHEVNEELRLSYSDYKDLGLSKKDWRDFKPSDLAFHPTTGDLYLLSSAGKRIIILTPNGQPLHSIALSPAIFVQPEGISFSPDGTLYISSEGDGGKGYILSFVR